MAISVTSYSEIKDKARIALIEALTELGRRAALKAYNDRSFTNRTYNLHDSYGSAVYVDGVLVEDSIKYIENAVSNTTDERAPQGYETGRSALKTYFKETFVVKKKDSYTILVAAAMWYASMVEKKKYKVLPYENVKSYIAQNFDSVVLPVLKKYNIEFIMPMIRKGIGVDNEYFRFGGSRNTR